MNTRKTTLAVLFTSFIMTGLLQAQTGIPVQVRPLSEVLVDLERSAPAIVRSLNATTLSAEVNAVIQQIGVETGQVVKQGDVLLDLDATDYRLALNQAEANLAANIAEKAQADARLNRARALGANQYLSADDLLLRETEVMVIAARIQVQQASVDIARRTLEKCRIIAPFNGVVIERTAQVGAFVSTGSPLVELTQTDSYELDAEIPDELADSLENAHEFRFISRNESWPVRLLRLSPVVNIQRRSRQARFEFVDRAPAIGRSGEIYWRFQRGLLPVNLVVRRDGVLGVFLHRAGKAVFTPLPGAQEGRPVVVKLPLTSQIVVQGRERLQDGDDIVPSVSATQ